MVVILTTCPNISNSFIVLSIESVRGFPSPSLVTGLTSDQGLFNAVAVMFIGAGKRLG